MDLKAQLQDLCNQACVGSNSVLMIGAMEGKFMEQLPCEKKIALDAYAPYLSRIPFPCIKLNGTVQEILPLLGPRTVDTVLAIDFIEHLDKSDGLELLSQMNYVAARVAAIFTPNGFFKQDASNTQYTDEELHWQTHRSGWTEEDFKGWDVKHIPKAWKNFPAGGIWAQRDW